MSERLDRRVADQVGVSRAKAHDLVTEGAVQVDGRVERRPSAKVAEGAVVVVDHEPEVVAGLVADSSVTVPVVHVDEHLYVVDKPAGLVVHPGSGTGDEATLVHGLLALDPAIEGVGPDPDRPGIVHRLDRGTSGLMLVARTEDAHARLTAMLAAHDVERDYVTLVEGTIPEATGRIEAPLGRDPQRPTLQAVVPDGREAATDYVVEQRFPSPATSLLTVSLETGRTHQIRVHLSAIGHPVVGDRAYGATVDLGLDRPFLHSARVAFDHPVTGEHLTFESPLPADLQAALP